MKKISMVLSALFISTLTFAQTAEEVIANYIKAVGGNDAIAQIKDLSMSMTGEVQGQSLEVLIQRKPSNKFLQSISVAGMGEVQKQVCDGTKAQIGGMQGSQDITDPEKVKTIAMQAFIVPEANYASMGGKMTYIGKEKVGEVETYKIEVLLGGAKMTEFYDITSGLKLRQIINAETAMGSQTITSDFSDYREVKGVKIPHKIGQDVGMAQFTLTATKVEVNTNLADALFEIK
jgi:zinc protease